MIDLHWLQGLGIVATLWPLYVQAIGLATLCKY